MQSYGYEPKSKDLLNYKFNKMRWLGITIMQRYIHKNNEFVNRTGITKAEIVKFRLAYLGVIVVPYMVLMFMPANSLTLVTALVLPILHLFVTPALLVLLFGYYKKGTCSEYVENNYKSTKWF